MIGLIELVILLLVLAGGAVALVLVLKNSNKPKYPPQQYPGQYPP